MRTAPPHPSHPHPTPPHPTPPYTHMQTPTAAAATATCRALHDYDPDYQLAKEREGMWEDEWYEGGSHHEAPEDKHQEEYKR